MLFDPSIWGPHYWFVLHTIAHSYPLTPNAVTKRKYYDFIQNLPLFIPNEEIGNKFSHLLDKYPVSPYLDNRDSFIRWMFFIHNKVNAMLGKEELLYDEAYAKYYAEYKPKQQSLAEKFHLNKNYIHYAFFLMCIFIIYVFYDK